MRWVLVPVVAVAAAALAGYSRRGLSGVTDSRWMSPMVVGALGAGFGGLSAWRASSVADAAVLGVTSVASALLVATDMAEHEVPHRVLWPSVLALLSVSVVAAASDHQVGRVGQVVGCGVAMAVAYFAVAWFGKGRFGLGDVSLSLLLGMFLGWFGPGTALVAGLGAFVIQGIVLSGSVVFRRSKPETEVPFGPAMIVSAWAAAFVAASLLRVLIRL